MRSLPKGRQGRLRVGEVVYTGFCTMSFRETHTEEESIKGHDMNELLKKKGACFREGLREEKFQPSMPKPNLRGPCMAG